MKGMCFIGANPNFLGGISVYQKNLIDYLIRNMDVNITWAYRGEVNKTYVKDGVTYVEIRSPFPSLIGDWDFNNKVLNYLKNNAFDIINSHAIWGYWIKKYKKKKNEKIIHTYHGSTYYFFLNHSKSPGMVKKIFSFFGMIFGYIIEKWPYYYSDKIISVSNKVSSHLEKLYGKRKNIFVLRTGVNIRKFTNINKGVAKKELGLNMDYIYGLYVGRGGYWTKGLDRVIKLSEELYKLNDKFRLIIVGPDKDKVDSMVNKKFVQVYDQIPREHISKYFSASDIFFCLSRYEGGAPTLVVSEAMASGCFVVCSEDSEQEIIINGDNGLIINKFDEEDAHKILKMYGDGQIKRKIIRNSVKTIKNISIDNWAREYLDVLLK